MKFPVSRVLALAMFVILAAPSQAQGGSPATTSPASVTPASATKQTPGTAPAVGVIDVAAIVDQYPVFIKMRASLDARFSEFKEKITASTEKLEQMRMTLGSMAEDAPQRADFAFQYKMGLQNHDFQRKNANDQLANEELRLMLMIYEDLDYSVAKVANKRGVTIVIPKRDIPPSPTPVADMRMRDVQDRVGAFQRRTVWFAAKEVDLTSAVIKYMQDPLPPRTSPERAPKPLPAGQGTRARGLDRPGSTPGAGRKGG